MNSEFKGKTEEAIATLKEDVHEVKENLQGMKTDLGKVDKKIWIILLFLVAFVAEKAPSLVGAVLAWGK